MKKLKDFARHELIGLNITIIDSKNKANIGIQGKIIDEGKNTITILHEKRHKTLLKKNIIFETKIKDKTIRVKGEILTKRPEERVKTK